jgi:hypothetical protein
MRQSILLSAAASMMFVWPVIADADLENGDVIVLEQSSTYISDGNTSMDKNLWDLSEFARAMGNPSTVLHSWREEGVDQLGSVNVFRTIDGVQVSIASGTYHRYDDDVSGERTFRLINVHSGSTTVEIKPDDFIKFIPGDMMSPSFTVWMNTSVVDQLKDQTNTVVLGFKKTE